MTSRCSRLFSNAVRASGNRHLRWRSGGVILGVDVGPDQLRHVNDLLSGVVGCVVLVALADAGLDLDRLQPKSRQTGRYIRAYLLDLFSVYSV